MRVRCMIQAYNFGVQLLELCILLIRAAKTVVGHGAGVHGLKAHKKVVTRNSLVMSVGKIG